MTLPGFFKGYFYGESYKRIFLIMKFWRIKYWFPLQYGSEYEDWCLIRLGWLNGVLVLLTIAIAFFILRNMRRWAVAFSAFTTGAYLLFFALSIASNLSFELYYEHEIYSLAQLELGWCISGYLPLVLIWLVITILLFVKGTSHSEINHYAGNKQIEKSTPISQNSLDEILKFKQLLDMGAITQEEFDIQKKKLLDLSDSHSAP